MLCSVVALVAAFTAPMTSRATAVRASPVTMQMTDFSWRQTFNGKPPGEFAPAPWTSGTGVVVPTGAAPSGEMSVPQACIFMSANPDITPEAKAAFLAEKGVSAFVIAQADCTAAADNVQGHP